MHVVWRIGTETETFAADDLSGTGAKLSGGRWNEKNFPVVYASTTRSLACLETIVHLNARGLPQNRYLVEIAIPADLWTAARRETAASLPVGWDAEPASKTSIDFGTAWLKSGSSAILVVPSVIVPEEFNILLNPRHANFPNIRARKIRKWQYDARFFAA